MKVDEDEDEGGRKVMLELDFDAEDDDEGLLNVVLKTGGQGGKVGDEKLDVDEMEDERSDDDVVSVMLTELDGVGRDEAVGMLEVKLEGKSKVMDDGTSGTDVEYDG